MTGKQEILGLSLSPELGKCGIVPPRGVTKGTFSTGRATLKLGFYYLDLGWALAGLNPCVSSDGEARGRFLKRRGWAKMEDTCILPETVLL